MSGIVDEALGMRQMRPSAGRAGRASSRAESMLAAGVSSSALTNSGAISDTSQVFDEMLFADVNEAQFGLLRNGFLLQRAEIGRWRALRPPQPPFVRGRHPNGRIYSSGRFWR